MGFLEGGGLCYAAMNVNLGTRFWTLGTAIGLMLTAGMLARKGADGRSAGAAAASRSAGEGRRPVVAAGGRESDGEATGKIRQRERDQQAQRERLETRRREVVDELEAMRKARLGRAHPQVLELRRELQHLDERLHALSEGPAGDGADDASGEQGMFGFSLGVSKNADVPLQVKQVLEGSPADFAMIFPGDEILAIDGEDLTGQSFDEAYARLKGPVGEAAVLTVRPNPESEPLEIRISRIPFPETPVR